MTDVRTITFLGGAAALLLSAVIGFIPVNADYDAGAGALEHPAMVETSCGSAFAPEDYTFYPIRVACADALPATRIPAVVLALIGVLCTGAGLVLSTTARPSTARSSWTLPDGLPPAASPPSATPSPQTAVSAGVVDPIPSRATDPRSEIAELQARLVELQSRLDDDPADWINPAP